MSITPLRFTGVSSFSEDFQSILNRAVSIAVLPIKLLQNQQADLLSKKQTLTSISGAVNALKGAVSRLGQLGANRSLAATSSNTSRVTVSLNGASAPASYVITDISSVARPAAENTLTGYASADATPVDVVDDTVTLVFAGARYDLDLATYGNHLNGVRNAINALGIGLAASVLNTGEPDEPYYLSLTALVPGVTTLALLTDGGDPGTNILTSANQGVNTVFKFNGLTITRSDKVITDVAEGLTFTVLDTTAPGETVSLTLASSRTALATALQDFVSAYNTLTSALNLQIGENAGLLSGDYIIRQIKATLKELTGYRGAGTVSTLADFGISLDKQGVMSFDSKKLYAFSSDLLDAGFGFLGSSTTGFGALASQLTGIGDPISGLIKTQQDSYDASDARISSSIAEISARIERMQLALTEKLQQADVVLSTLAAQQRLLDASIEGFNLTLYGRKDSR